MFQDRAALTWVLGKVNCFLPPVHLSLALLAPQYWNLSHFLCSPPAPILSFPFGMLWVCLYLQRITVSGYYIIGSTAPNMPDGVLGPFLPVALLSEPGTAVKGQRGHAGWLSSPAQCESGRFRRHRFQCTRKQTNTC